MAAFALVADRDDPRFASLPAYVSVCNAPTQTRDLREAHRVARERARAETADQMARNRQAARAWAAGALAPLVVLLVSTLLRFWPGVVLGVVGSAYALYVSFVRWRGAERHSEYETARLEQIDEQYSHLIALSEQADQEAAENTEHARARYRAWWKAFRKEEGGYDVFLLEILDTLDVELRFYQRLRQDFELYYDFLRSVMDGPDGKAVPVLYELRRRAQDAKATGQPTTLAERRAAIEAAAHTTFAAHEEKDPDVAAYLAARVRDAGARELPEGEGD